ncbi:hypothetical protein AS026_38175 [Rhizobium altiplani]|uniref:Uncharacterized protein n=1 Tax=Rhizobium altiplani TaxID=1864509 RepID=A0A109JTT1_9HYPH|nr:hypothetical protein AS026_38175 [Rhizobium altiplani]
MARLQASDAAYDAPIAIDRGKLQTNAKSIDQASADRAIASALHFVVAGRGASVIHKALRVDGAFHASLSRLFTRHS